MYTLMLTGPATAAPATIITDMITGLRMARLVTTSLTMFTPTAVAVAVGNPTNTITDMIIAMRMARLATASLTMLTPMAPVAARPMIASITALTAMTMFVPLAQGTAILMFMAKIVEGPTPWPIPRWAASS